MLSVGNIYTNTDAEKDLKTEIFEERPKKNA